MNNRPLQSGTVQRGGFTLVELLVVIAIIGILVALLLPAIQSAREAARRAQCQSNIKNVALAVLTYGSAQKDLPQGMTFPKGIEQNIGRLIYFSRNWIISVLPYLEEQALYDSFNFKRAINDPITTNPNCIAHATSIPVLLCPSDPYNRVMYQGGPDSGHYGSWARGNYAGNSGNAFLYYCASEECSYSADSPGWLSDQRRGVMGPNASIRYKRIVDGTSKTILIGEIRAGITDKDARGVWALGHAGASLLAAYGSGTDDNGPNTCNPEADDVYSDACGSSDALSLCMDCYAGTHFAQQTVRSLHNGGAFVAMCDGSVQFITDDVETSGVFGNWGSLWDRLIASADDGMPGPFNGTMP
jgi:prepilin-type N-terminal cleavage/methylation domain-containing protein/prepilin-type processing-associated H-X9-DG protein